MQMTTEQFDLVKRQFATLKERSPFYAAKFADIDLADVQTQEDFEKLPFSEKDDLRRAYPLGLQAVPDEEVVRIHSSPAAPRARRSSSRTRSRTWPTGPSSSRAATRRRASPTPTASRSRPGYGLWTAGIGFQLGAERLGAMAIPMGPGNTEKQLKMMQDLKSTVLCATSSYALLLAEEIAERGIRDKLCLRKGVIGSERWGDKMRAAHRGRAGRGDLRHLRPHGSVRPGHRHLVQRAPRHARVGRLRVRRGGRSRNGRVRCPTARWASWC